MSENEIIALITTSGGIVIAIINAVLLRGPIAKVLAKIGGIEHHLGIKTDDAGKVIVLDHAKANGDYAAAAERK